MSISCRLFHKSVVFILRFVVVTFTYKIHMFSQATDEIEGEKTNERKSEQKERV